MLRNFFINLSANNAARRFVTHFGPVRRMARRFVAGETLDEAVAVVKDLNGRGIKVLLNEVGESVTSQAEASQAAAVFHKILQRIDAEGLDADISLKPSHVGMTFSPDFCYENIADIVQTAQQYRNIVEIDMEGSPDVDATLSVYHRLLDTFGRGIRLAIQSYLYRTPSDVQRIIEHGGAVRLVKGAYKEPPDIAHQSKTAINQATIRTMELFFTPEARAKKAYLILGSHDPELIEWLIRETNTQGISPKEFEFQMLLGIRRDEQQRLADLGYQVRVYVPYGPAWYPYFMRRLAERPANVLFIGRAMLGK
ncbi:MAG TPA: proline dehydrogenase family protein [Anaerolineae bacterium]|nr:proline dehydrogenase family protein [Anaerolineae bacterium]